MSRDASTGSGPAPALPEARRVPSAPDPSPAPDAPSQSPTLDLRQASLAPLRPEPAASPSPLLDRDRGPERLIDPARALVAIAAETYVYAEPRFGSRKLGYLRAGARVTRAAQAASRRGCPEGFYPISPEGFVCVGKTASLDPEHPVARAAQVRANREREMPYVYGMSRFPPPPLYTRVPTRQERAQVEAGLGAAPRATGWEDVPVDPIPDFLQDGRGAPSLAGYRHTSLHLGRAVARSGFSLLSVFQADGRSYGLTADLKIVPIDRLRRIVPSKFHGVELREGQGLPLVFVLQRGAQLWQGDPSGAGLKPLRPLEYREAVSITGERRQLGSASWLRTVSGDWLRDEGLVRLDAPQGRPSWAKGDRSWIDVSISKQALVAYVGERPVYATLVSTGAGGLGDPEKTHATPQGRFLIHTKHVSATMDSDEVGDEFDLRDVPYVQYFKDGYAFHTAYWHDAFGKPKSHGCINLAPEDARWLFHWSDPPVPSAWHGASSLRDGTLVNIHP